MEIFFIWIVGCVIAGFIGSERSIGFWGAFFLSLVLSPLIGIIASLVSKSNEQANLEKQMLSNQSQLQNSNVYGSSLADELRKLKELKDEGVITDEEFERQKSIILGNQ